jgi:hypothetical protein
VRKAIRVGSLANVALVVKVFPQVLPGKRRVVSAFDGKERWPRIIR